MCVCVCVYIYIYKVYIHTHMYTHTHTHTNTHMYLHIYLCMYVCVSICIYTYIHRYTYLTHVHFANLHRVRELAALRSAAGVSICTFALVKQVKRTCIVCASSPRYAVPQVGVSICTSVLGKIKVNFLPRAPTPCSTAADAAPPLAASRASEQSTFWASKQVKFVPRESTPC